MRVLVVDDDIIIRHFFTRTLRRHAEVHEACGVAEAMSKLRTIDFDVVLTDEHMPDGRGRALLAKVAEVQPLCRRVLMSGRELDLDGAGDESSDHFFPKAGGLVDIVTWIRGAGSRPRSCERSSGEHALRPK